MSTSRLLFPPDWLSGFCTAAAIEEFAHGHAWLGIGLTVYAIISYINGWRIFLGKRLV